MLWFIMRFYDLTGLKLSQSNITQLDAWQRMLTHIQKTVYNVLKRSEIYRIFSK